MWLKGKGWLIASAAFLFNVIVIQKRSGMITKALDSREGKKLKHGIALLIYVSISVCLCVF